MVQRLTYRRRHSYATKSNKQRILRTPGGKLVYQLAKKKTSHPTCPISGQRLNGVRRRCCCKGLLQGQRLLQAAPPRAAGAAGRPA